MTSKPPLTQRRREATLLELSDTAAELFVRRGIVATTVQDIADAAGVSARTFHRYFASKADALRPRLREGLLHYVTLVAALPPERPLVEGLCDALERALNEPRDALDVEITRLTVTTEELQPAWLRAHEDCAMALGPVLARRLDPSADEILIRYASASVVTANRLAVETWIHQGGEARPYLDRCLRLLTQGVLPAGS